MGETVENVAREIDSYSYIQSLGVCLGITPFNFPAMIPLWMFPMAIACGNAFILKPSEQDPMTSNKLAELFVEAGAPPNILQVIHGNKEQVDILIKHPDIKAISFVGSVPVGQYIYKTGTEHLKRVQSFAGAKNHMVVMPDANKNKTIDSLVGSSVGAAGQRCMAISVAVFVGSSKDWIEDLKNEMEMVKPGPWDSEESGFGPVISPQAKEIERTREMTDKPFGVNLTVLPTINPPPYEEYAQAIVGSGVKIVETAGRSPEPFMELFKEYDVKVIHKCTSVRHALKAQSVGVSAITIDGFECAGHPGEDDIPSLVLLPQAAEALDVPVAGCGGFSDAKSMVAALALGGEAIVMGTRFMATQEAGIHQNVKQKMTEADELSTNLMFRTMHNTARVFKNSVSDQVVEIESTGNATFEDVKDLVAGQRGRVVFEEGDLEHGIWSAGISVARVKDVPTCKEMVSRLVSEAEEIIDGRLQSVKA